MQAQNAMLSVVWEDEMKSVNKYVLHRHVVALLLYWDIKEGWTDMNTEEEVRLLNIWICILI